MGGMAGYGDAQFAENDTLKGGVGHMSKMLDLKIGGFYRFKCGPYSNYVGQVRAKSIHSKKTHTYFVAWPNERDKGSHTPIGIYLWDEGWANKGYSGFLTRPIIECQELSSKEKEEVIAKFQRLGQHY